MSSPFRRILKLQQQILRAIRAEMRRALGVQPAGLRRYYGAYEREFRGKIRVSSKEALLKACNEADVILIGDYHTFAQSQKAALRLLRQFYLPTGQARATRSARCTMKLAMGMEMIPSHYQEALDAYVAGKLSEKDFLSAIHYNENWGFPWEHFRPLLDFAIEHKLPVIALNHQTESLHSRDAHAGKIIAQYCAANPDSKMLVIFGDLHLARGHLPKALGSELKARGLKRRLVVIFQNSESVYWRLADSRGSHSVEVAALGQGRFCIMNAAPWVKLQSYLEWTGAGELFEIDEDGKSNLYEIAFERLRNLTEALALSTPPGLDFTIATLDDLSFLGRIEGVTREELKAVKYLIMGNRNVFIPTARILYLASPSVNSVCEGVSAVVHSELSGWRQVFHDPARHFFPTVLAATVAYFGSKVLNPKRKCSLEDDFRLLLEQKHDRSQRAVAQLVLKHCRAQRDYQRGGRYSAPFSSRGPGRIPLFLETSRCLGAILGEKLYAAYMAGSYPSARLQGLFSTTIDRPESARDVYLRLVKDLARSRLEHSSKFDLF